MKRCLLALTLLIFAVSCVYSQETPPLSPLRVGAELLVGGGVSFYTGVLAAVFALFDPYGSATCCDIVRAVILTSSLTSSGCVYLIRQHRG